MGWGVGDKLNSIKMMLEIKANELKNAKGYQLRLPAITSCRAHIPETSGAKLCMYVCPFHILFNPPPKKKRKLPVIFKSLLSNKFIKTHFIPIN